MCCLEEDFLRRQWDIYQEKGIIMAFRHLNMSIPAVNILT